MRVVTIVSVLVVALAAAGPCHGSPVRDLQHGLGIDDANWKISNESDNQICWLTKYNEGVTLTVNHPPSEVHDPDNQKALEGVFRDQATRFQGGLIEVKPFESNGVKGVLVTMKFKISTFNPKGGDGVAYQMNAIIPTTHGDYVLQIAAAETGTTGIREATVTVIDMAQRNIKDIKDEANRFRRDPYDSKYDADALYMISDDRKWDASFPDHPLTRIRIMMDSMIKTLKISEQIKSDALFKD